jgi:SAM-dependent methyltransferase
MKTSRRTLFASIVCASTLFGQAAAPARTPDVPYVPTPENVVEAMLKLGEVKKGDILYDLGSGDGRIVVAAAKNFGVKGTGIDINPERIQEANANAKQAGVTDRVRFLNQDLFEADIKDATVVTLYLLPSINLKLRPKLWKDLKPGTRIVSHSFDMGDWAPEKKVEVDGRNIYLWRVPSSPPTAAAK